MIAQLCSQHIADVAVNDSNGSSAADADAATAIAIVVAVMTILHFSFAFAAMLHTILLSQLVQSAEKGWQKHSMRNNHHHHLFSSTHQSLLLRSCNAIEITALIAL